MKGSSLGEEESAQEIPHTGSPSKQGDGGQVLDAPGFSDLDLIAGFSEIP